MASQQELDLLVQSEGNINPKMPEHYFKELAQRQYLLNLDDNTSKSTPAGNSILISGAVSDDFKPKKYRKLAPGYICN